MNAAAEDIKLVSQAGNVTPDGADPVARLQAIKRAREKLSQGTQSRIVPDYPVAALGPLAETCRTIAEHGQVREAMAGQCLLGAASLMTQGLYNVETLAGRRPLSLNLLTLGDSGDGKTTAQDVVLHRVTEWQRAQSAAYRKKLQAREEARGSRRKVDDAPQAPTQPYRLVSDATVEGLRRDLEAGPISQGVFSDEAAAVLTGYGMSADHRAKTAAVFAKLWDNGHLSVSRAVGGRVERYGLRLAIHWLIQPAAAAEVIGDPLMSALGFWPRFLVAWPEAQQARKARKFRPDDVEPITAYWRRCDELLMLPLGDDVSACPLIELSPEAHQQLCIAFESFEREARGGTLRMVKPFALRATEQACRVAGVLAAFAGERMVSYDLMRGALALVGYSISTWRSLIDEGAGDQRSDHALRLFEWLTTRPNWAEELAVILSRGPGCLRKRDARDAAVAELEAAGLVSVVGKVLVAVREQAS